MTRLRGRETSALERQQRWHTSTQAGTRKHTHTQEGSGRTMASCCACMAATAPLRDTRLPQWSSSDDVSSRTVRTSSSVSGGGTHTHIHTRSLNDIHALTHTLNSSRTHAHTDNMSRNQPLCHPPRCALRSVARARVRVSSSSFTLTSSRSDVTCACASAALSAAARSSLTLARASAASSSCPARRPNTRCSSVCIASRSPW